MTDAQLKQIQSKHPDISGVALWDSGKGFLGCLLDPTLRPIPGSTPWEPLPSMEAVWKHLFLSATIYAEDNDTNEQDRELAQARRESSLFINNCAQERMT